VHRYQSFFLRYVSFPKRSNITAFNVFTIISDVVILLLPVPMLSSINRPLKEKIALVGVFFAGTFATISSCVRIYSLHQFYNHAQNGDGNPIATWSQIEINLGIVCSSGPGTSNFVTPLTSERSKHSITNSSEPKMSQKRLRSPTMMSRLFQIYDSES
jgi:hypothetical protein